MTPGRWAALRVSLAPQNVAPQRASLPLVSLRRMLFSMTSLSDNTSAPHASDATTQAGMDAFEAFFWRYERDILGYLWRLTGDEQMARDLSQETFLRAWQRFDTLQRYDQPRAWLFRVASNLGINHLRGRSRSGWLAPITEDTQTLAMHGGDLVSRLAERDTIRQALLGLPPRQRAAVTLCDVYGFTSAEAAAALGLSHGSLKMSLWRGRERFRQEYQRTGGAE